MDNSLLSALLLLSIPLSFLALICSLVCIAVVVGLRNSTHKIEWKTWDPHSESVREAEEEDDEVRADFLEDVNPNKRKKRNEPFQPFPAPVPEEEPFFDETDPNNVSHDFHS